MKLEKFCSELIAQLDTKNKLVILTHHNPDGDAIGSSLALQLMLEKIGKKAEIIVPNDFPKFLKWLPNANKIQIAEQQPLVANQKILNAEMVFCLDF